MNKFFMMAVVAAPLLMATADVNACGCDPIDCQDPSCALAPTAGKNIDPSVKSAQDPDGKSILH